MIISHPGIQPEIAIAAIPDDERVWVPQADKVWFRPLLLNTVTGSWCNLLRVRKAGVLSKHIHPSMVVGYVIKGAWRYLEHDWVARQGAFVYEPPGEVHTLVVDEGHEEMITFFNIQGAMVYVDGEGDRPAMKMFIPSLPCAGPTMRLAGSAQISWISSCDDRGVGRGCVPVVEGSRFSLADSAVPASGDSRRPPSRRFSAEASGSCWSIWSEQPVYG